MEKSEASRRAPRRLSGRQPGEVIDRSGSVRFIFDNRQYTAHPGDTIASALAAAGVKVFSRSFKYHRPRGLLCCAGQCPNCLVQVGDEPNVRACMRPVEEGMQVQPQNAWPSLDRDLMSLTGVADRFLPVGFYYKAFMRPQSLWPKYEDMLRHIAGLGIVNPDTPPGTYDKQYLHADVAVVGGGPAGMSAALAAAEQGARVMLFDENPALGGHLRYAGNEEPGRALYASLLGAVEQSSHVSIYTGTTILGRYEDNWLSAAKGSRLFKIRARSLVVATGAYERPLVFENNDLPGVMLGSAVQRLLHLYGVASGRRAVVVTANEDGWAVAAALFDAGVGIAGIVDERAQTACASPHLQKLVAAVPVYWQATIKAARGTDAVTSVVISSTASSEQVIDCDLVAISTGWTPVSDLVYQAGGKLAYDETRNEILPPTGDPAPGIYVAGRAAGSHRPALQMLEGRLAGLKAAAYVAAGQDQVATVPSATEQKLLAERKAAEPRRTSDRISVPGKKKCFLCFCEDVTTVDLETAIQEGYDSIELLKRYSTISMGPCQGKMCSMNAVHLCAQANRMTVAQTGTTTLRPPLTPVSLGVLAGQNMEPVQITPIHDWHLAHQAKMMVTGLWLRPERYGDPVQEVLAVRQRVGLIDVSTLGKIRLKGPGVPTLLDRLYVNQWGKLGQGRVRYGVMCNDEGVILDDGVCAHLGETAEPDEWYMSTTSSGANAIFDSIQWWMQSGWGEGVIVQNVAEDFAAFNLAGPQSRSVLQKLTGLDISNKAFPYMHVRSAEVAGVPCRILRIGFTGELSYEIHCPAGYGLHLWQALMAAGEEFGILPFGVEAQRVLRLEKAHIIVSQDTDAMTDPLSADMGWAVKMEKVDFLGKRSLVRVAAEGSKQRLVGFKMENTGIVPDEGSQIVLPGAGPQGGTGTPERAQIVGWITSSRFSPTLQAPIGLCWLRADLAAEVGTPFTIRLNGKLERASVFHGPFYDPTGERLRM